MALKHAKTSAAGPSADPAKVGGDDWNASHTVDADGFDMVASSTLPTAPAVGNVRLFGRFIAGRAMPAFIGPSGTVSTVQPFFGTNKIGLWSGAGNISTGGLTNFGLPPPTAIGTAATRVVATTSYFASLRRLGYSSAATAGAKGGANGPAQFWRGDIVGCGGFLTVFRFGCSDAATVDGSRTFVGLTSNGNITSNDPTTYLNFVGVGTDAADTNLCIMSNDGAGVATKTDLGSNFPDRTLSTDVYQLAMFCPPNGGFVEWEITRLNTGDRKSGVINSDLPSANVLLLPIFVRSNNAATLAVSIDIMSLYIETDS